MLLQHQTGWLKLKKKLRLQFSTVLLMYKLVGKKEEDNIGLLGLIKIHVHFRHVVVSVTTRDCIKMQNCLNLIRTVGATLFWRCACLVLAGSNIMTSTEYWIVIYFIFLVNLNKKFCHKKDANVYHWVIDIQQPYMCPKSSVKFFPSPNAMELSKSE